MGLPLLLGSFLFSLSFFVFVCVFVIVNMCQDAVRITNLPKYIIGLVSDLNRRFYGDRINGDRPTNRPTNRVNVEQSASGRLEGRVLQKHPHRRNVTSCCPFSLLLTFSFLLLSQDNFYNFIFIFFRLKVKI